MKAAVVKQLKQIGAYYFYPVTGGYGRSGVPDVVGCYRGLFFAIECKTVGNKPTTLQEKNMAAITASGGLTWVVDERNVASVAATLLAHTQ